jgi:hypothetical protein
MPKRLFLVFVWFASAAIAHAQPQLFETTAVTAFGDTARFRVQIPSGYDRNHPPAILVGWHALGGSQIEIFNWEYDELCEQRGWIIASHMGPNDRHWNTRLPQLHCRAMLDWLAENYPFSRDSIYMLGGSMGGAAGQVWHNNNCAYDDYLIAATVGGSQILDCQLRQEQYLAAGDTNRSMRVAFGGFPFESDSVAYEYHRYSAVHLADTLESMHFNALTIPVWSRWSEEPWEWDAYGFPAMDYEMLRQGRAESNFESAHWVGHGFAALNSGAVCEWLSHFAVNRFPDTLSLAADEDGRYYYCDVTLGDSPYQFARWDIRKNAEEKRLDLSLIRNVRELTIQFVFPWTELDTLRCDWIIDSSANPNAMVTIKGIPANYVVRTNANTRLHAAVNGDLLFTNLQSEAFEIIFDSVTVALPTSIEIVSAYPNPFNGELTVLIDSYDSRTEEIKLFNVLGQRVFSKRVQLAPSLNRVSLSLPGVASGSYWMQTGNGTPLRVVLIR